MLNFFEFVDALSAVDRSTNKQEGLPNVVDVSECCSFDGHVGIARTDQLRRCVPDGSGGRQAPDGCCIFRRVSSVCDAEIRHARSNAEQW